MGLLNIIRWMALREKLSIREIARRTGLSRNTVTKHLNAGTIEPKFVVPKRPSKLDDFADKLADWLKTETRNSRKAKHPHCANVEERLRENGVHFPDLFQMACVSPTI